MLLSKATTGAEAVTDDAADVLSVTKVPPPTPAPPAWLSAILGAALTGIEDQVVPSEPIKGNAYASKLDTLPDDWAEAVRLFEQSDLMQRILPKELIRNYLMTKKQELKFYADLSEAERIDLYLDTV